MGSWLHPHMGTTAGDGDPPRAYLITLQHVVSTLDDDPAWQDWWRQSGLGSCELGIVAEGQPDHLRPSADIRQVDGCLRANFTCALPTDGSDLSAHAVTELRAMFEVIREAMTLPALPPTPALPTLPPDTPDVPMTTRSLPSLPHELEQQGYLTLAQIQEFFG